MTIDDDVAAALEQLREKHDVSLKVLVNVALRRGFQDLAARQTQRDHFQTRSVDLGGVSVAYINSASETLTVAESETFD